MDTFIADIRYGTRLLRKAPAFSFITVLTLALGIGANTAIYSVVDAVLIRPLPYTDPDALVMVWEDASDISFPRNPGSG
jgi:putative ABC transport system permease protein